MYLVEQPEPLRAVHAAIDAAYKAGRTYDDPVLADLYRDRWRLEEEYSAYFRLNIWGMGRYRDVMEAIGMLEWSEGEAPGWPEYHHYDVPMREVESAYTPGSTYTEPVEDDPRYAAWEAAYDAKLRWTDTDVIAGHKLCDNSGWIVTPREIARTLDVYYAWREEHDIRDLLGLDDDKEPEYWNKWIAFLETACEAGGFEVH